MKSNEKTLPDIHTIGEEKISEKISTHLLTVLTKRVNI